MHLWPSMRIRDSFKIAYLKKLEWNLHRMNSEKKRSQESESTSNNSNQEKLLDDNSDTNDPIDSKTVASSCLKKAGLVCGEILMIFTCCYCCFCCGACVDEDEA